MCLTYVHYYDGNGRMGRLWQSVILAHWHDTFRWIPVESLIYAHQQTYYDVLQQSHEIGQCNAFIEFMLDIMLQTLDELLTEWNEAGRPLRQTTEQVGRARETSSHKAGTSKTGTSRKEGTSNGAKKRLIRSELYELVRSCCEDWSTIQEISHRTGRTTKYLSDKIIPEMIERHLIERRYPDTPNHPNQQYKCIH